MKSTFKKLSVLAFVIGTSFVGLTSCGESARLTIVHFDQAILGETQKDLGVSIGIKKGNTELETAINSALATISTETRNEMMLNAVLRSNGEEVNGATPISNPTNNNTKTLTIGVECNYAPFNWTETSSNDWTYPIVGKTNEYADGYDIQIAKYLANEMNYNLNVVKMSWEALIPALNNGTINAVVAGMTDTEDRRQSIDFSEEYYRSEMVLVVKEGTKYATSTSLDNFSGAKIVSQVSTVTDDVISSWVDSYNIVHLNAVDTFGTAALAVQSGAADAMTAELPVAQAIVNGTNR